MQSTTSNTPAPSYHFIHHLISRTALSGRISLVLSRMCLGKYRTSNRPTVLYSCRSGVLKLSLTTILRAFISLHLSPGLCRSDFYIDETSRPLLKELNGSNANCEDADDSLDRAEDELRVHDWLPNQ